VGRSFQSIGSGIEQFKKQEKIKQDDLPNADHCRNRQTGIIHDTGV
jgi:hypothetical protein